MNQATQHSEVLEFPSRTRQVHFADGYRKGLTDGESFASTRFVWLGAFIGVIFSALLVIAMFAYIGFFR